MDLIFILIGMAVGGAFGFGLADAIAGYSTELRLALSTVGSMVGGGGGYFMAWLIKLPTRAVQPAAKLTRSFRPQVVGSRCASCDERIIVIVDADVCPQCGRVFCKKCVSTMPCPQCRAEISYLEPEIVDAAIVIEEPIFLEDPAERAPEKRSAAAPDIFIADFFEPGDDASQ